MQCTERECLMLRHYGHFTASDFDRSPYFDIIKPAIAHGFPLPAAALVG